MKDFKQTSLCNVLYKIISKVLVNRLKNILPKCISQEQATFVEDKSILDNVMLDFEVIHHIRSKQKGKIGKVTLKIDISKIFDGVNWQYLLNVLRNMGLHEK